MKDTPKKTKTAVIIGAGPAGLTAAFELLKHTDIHPIVLEKGAYIGGISRTVRFGENRMDIGGHRFFSKSEQIINWWLDMLPLESGNEHSFDISYQNKKHTITQQKKGVGDDVMMVRKRKSRIYYDGKFFEYPITLSFSTFKNLGIYKMVKIGMTYVYSLFFPIRPEKNLEDFYINRFGSELYKTFFKAYTEKVWGVDCTQIGADWGRQRVKGLSVGKALIDSVARVFRRASIDQKHTETSLIEYFLYPTFGPGHLWETVTKKIKAQGGTHIPHACVTGITMSNGVATGVLYTDVQTGEKKSLEADYVFSTMPIDELFENFANAPQQVVQVAQQLSYRDFITVGLLLHAEKGRDLDDNWIYIHDPEVQVGRIQFFHNWSPHMVAKKDTQLLGLEYFCNEGDELWQKSEAEIGALALQEVRKIGISQEEMIDFHVEKVEKAYPVYTGAYKDFETVRQFLDSVPNLYPIGRNGMHRYNNQDHSMLTAMASVQSILGNKDKSTIWDINTEQDYHEEK